MCAFFCFQKAKHDFFGVGSLVMRPTHPPSLPMLAVLVSARYLAVACRRGRQPRVFLSVRSRELDPKACCTTLSFAFVVSAVSDRRYIANKECEYRERPNLLRTKRPMGTHDPPRAIRPIQNTPTAIYAYCSYLKPQKRFSYAPLTPPSSTAPLTARPQ